MTRQRGRCGVGAAATVRPPDLRDTAFMSASLGRGRLGGLGEDFVVGEITTDDINVVYELAAEGYQPAIDYLEQLQVGVMYELEGAGGTAEVSDPWGAWHRGPVSVTAKGTVIFADGWQLLTDTSWLSPDNGMLIQPNGQGITLTGSNAGTIIDASGTVIVRPSASTGDWSSSVRDALQVIQQSAGVTSSVLGVLRAATGSAPVAVGRWVGSNYRNPYTGQVETPIALGNGLYQLSTGHAVPGPSVTGGWVNGTQYRNPVAGGALETPTRLSAGSYMLSTGQIVPAPNFTSGGGLADLFSGGTGTWLMAGGIGLAVLALLGGRRR